jgi:hypothetical protein
MSWRICGLVGGTGTEENRVSSRRYEDDLSLGSKLSRVFSQSIGVQEFGTMQMSFLLLTYWIRENCMLLQRLWMDGMDGWVKFPHGDSSKMDTNITEMGSWRIENARFAISRWQIKERLVKSERKQENKSAENIQWLLQSSLKEMWEERMAGIWQSKMKNTQKPELYWNQKVQKRDFEQFWGNKNKTKIPCQQRSVTDPFSKRKGD